MKSVEELARFVNFLVLFWPLAQKLERAEKKYFQIRHVSKISDRKQEFFYGEKKKKKK